MFLCSCLSNCVIMLETERNSGYLLELLPLVAELPTGVYSILPAFLYDLCERR